MSPPCIRRIAFRSAVVLHDEQCAQGQTGQDRMPLLSRPLVAGRRERSLDMSQMAFTCCVVTRRTIDLLNKHRVLDHNGREGRGSVAPTNGLQA